MSDRTPILMTPSDTCAFATIGALIAAKARPSAALSLPTADILISFASCGFESDSEILVDPAHVGLQLGPGDHVNDPPVLDDVVPVGHGLGEPEILLHQQDGEALLLQPRNGAADLLHDHRREALGRLVEQEKPRPRAQDAADGEHLLLAAGELGALAPQALAQVGKELENLLQRKPAWRHLRRQHQVLLYVEAREDAALLRADRYAEPGDGVRSELDRLPV